MRVTLELSTANGLVHMALDWPDGARIPATGERLLLGMPDSPAVHGVIRGVEWFAARSEHSGGGRIRPVDLLAKLSVRCD